MQVCNFDRTSLERPPTISTRISSPPPVPTAKCVQSLRPGSWPYYVQNSISPTLHPPVAKPKLPHPPHRNRPMRNQEKMNDSAGPPRSLVRFSFELTWTYLRKTTKIFTNLAIITQSTLVGKTRNYILFACKPWTRQNG